MPFADLMNDTISIYDEDENLVKEGIKASVQGGRSVLTMGADFAVKIGYFVERKTSSGMVERYKVLEPNFNNEIDEFPAHYQMKVVNVNAIPDPRTSSTVNTIHATGNARVYQNSVDNSINTYTTTQYKQALNKVKSDILDLDLDDVEQALTTKTITRITEEIESGSPNKDKLVAYISLLPTAVATLESLGNLATMVGLN